MPAMRILSAFIFFMLPYTSLAPAPSPLVSSGTQPRELSFRVLRTIPHRQDAFTQGLIWQNGSLLESTGRYGQSHVARLNPEDGSVMDLLPLPSQYFGEGLAPGSHGDLVVLTWVSQVALRLQQKPLAMIRKQALVHSTQGWGLTQWKGLLVASDGSATLTFLHPETLRPLKSLNVTLRGAPVSNLNELEVIDGWLAANVWMDNRVLFIHPRSGAVSAILDLSSLTQKNRTDPEAVLNGLAWDSDHKALWVTGKLWSRLYLISLQGLSPL